MIAVSGQVYHPSTPSLLIDRVKRCKERFGASWRLHEASCRGQVFHIENRHGARVILALPKHDNYKGGGIIYANKCPPSIDGFQVRSPTLVSLLRV